MNALDAGRIHEDFVCGSGLREVGNEAGVDLVGDMTWQRIGLEPVRTQRGVDQGKKIAKDTIVVEARNVVEHLDDRIAAFVEVALAVLEIRVESSMEEINEGAGECAVLLQHGRDIRVAERRANLTQIPGVCPERGGFAPRASAVKHK